MSRRTLIEIAGLLAVAASGGVFIGQLYEKVDRLETHLEEGVTVSATPTEMEPDTTMGVGAIVRFGPFPLEGTVSPDAVWTLPRYCPSESVCL